MTFPARRQVSNWGLDCEYISSLAVGFRDWLDKRAQMSDNLLTQ